MNQLSNLVAAGLAIFIVLLIWNSMRSKDSNLTHYLRMAVGQASKEGNLVRIQGSINKKRVKGTMRLNSWGRFGFKLSSSQGNIEHIDTIVFEYNSIATFAHVGNSTYWCISAEEGDGFEFVGDEDVFILHF